MQRYNSKKSKIVLIFLILLISVFFRPLQCRASDNNYFTFAAMSCSSGSDYGVNTPVLSALMAHMIKANPEIRFILFPGAFVTGSPKENNETLGQLEYWKGVVMPFIKKSNMEWPFIWPSIGNPESLSRQSQADFVRAFPDVFWNGPENEKGYTYSFDRMGIHFVSVVTDRWLPYDPADENRTASHYVSCIEWLEKDLAAARSRGVRYIFVMGQDPAFPASARITDSLPGAGWLLTHPNDPLRNRYLEIRNRFWDILWKYKVSAYICGYEHIYAREQVEGVYQIITGGAGAPLYDINPTYGKPAKYMPSWIPNTYERFLPLYRTLEYKCGPADNCQASPDFVGGRFFNYVVFGVNEKGVTVSVYGTPPKQGTDSMLPDNFRIELKDKFYIENKNQAKK